MHVRRRFAARLFTALAALALVLAPAQQARADVATDIAAAFLVTVIVGGGVIGSTVAFTVHDASIATRRELPSKGWSTAETIITTPQALAYNGLLVGLEASGDYKEKPLTALLLLPAALTSTMATHGIWGLASDKVDPGMLYGVSWAIGANLAFTSGAIGAAIDKRLPGTAFGVVEMMGTVPSLAVGITRLADPKGRDKGAWAALTAWSGALLVHGTASLIHGIRHKDDPKEKTDGHEKERTGWPSRLYLAPTLISDGVARVPGIVAGGAF